MTDRLMTREEAAEFLGLKAQTLANWTCKGRSGPKAIRVGSRAIRYRRCDLEAYLAAHEIGQAVEA